MAGLTWIITFLCAAGCHLSSPSPAPHSPLVVHTGQNVSLTCNITFSSEILWYVFRSDLLLPLLRVSESKFKGDIGNFYKVNRKFSWTRDPDSGLVSLEILAVEEGDAGLYFCSGLCDANVCVNRGTHLKVNGGEVNPSGENICQPCWSLGICVLPLLLALCLFVMIGFYLYSGKPVYCCCKSLKCCSMTRVTEDESLPYSSLRHPDKPHQSGRERPRLVEDLVIYSTVTSRRGLNG